ncbi:MAG: aldo/keto reductase [bacterium]|nr:aldo/keto reductase [bacterium]
MKSLPLNQLTSIPVLGFGTWQITGDECVKSVKKALEVGYRHIDTANAYGNHAQVAQGIKESGVAREEIFITTKVFYHDLHQEAVLKKCDQFLQELETEYLDLLLIHWPNKNVELAETLNAMNELKKRGKIKAIGVSNFTQRHLEDAKATGIEVTNNQVELHPSLNQNDLKEYCGTNNIVLTAYSPLGRGEDLELDIIKELALKYNATPSQVILNWIMTKNIVAIPKSVNEDRIKENFESLNWEMTAEDVTHIDANVPQGERILVPEWAEFDY